MIAAVRLRGPVDVDQQTEDTLSNLNLHKTNQLVVFEESRSIRGMMNHAKDFITFGEVTEETVEMIEEEEGSFESGDSFDTRPPRKGYEDTRSQVGQGGSLGEREDMDELVRRML